jgi:hypothetical protein
MKRFNTDYIHFTCITAGGNIIVANEAGIKSRKGNIQN